MSSYNNSKGIACVTGASGMVGSEIVKRLLKKGYQVRALSRKEFPLNPKVTCFKGDLTAKDLPQEFISGANIIFHCAAELHDESKMWEVNVLGTDRLLQLVKKSGINYFCYLGSIGVVGKTDKKWLNETTSCNPQNAYEKSKLAAENLVKKELEGHHVIILRPGNIIEENHPGPLFGTQRNSWQARMRIFIVGGECPHTVHAEDVAYAALYFINRDFPSPQCFNVSYDDEELNTNAEIWALLTAKDKVNTNNYVSKKTPHLPLAIPYFIRNFRKGAGNPGDVRYTSEKLFSEKFHFPLGLQGTINRMHTVKQLPSSSTNTGLLSRGCWAFSGKVTTTISSILINLILARILPPEALGTYFLLLSLAMLTAVLSQLGMNLAIVRFVAEFMRTNHPSKAAKAIRFAFFYVVTGISVVALCLNLGLGEWIADQLFDSLLIKGVIGITSVWMALLALQHFFAETFRGFHNIKMATITGGTLTSILTAIFLWLLWISKGQSNIYEVIYLTIIATSAGVALAGYLLWGKYQRINGPDNIAGTEILKVGLPLCLTNLMLFFLIQADIWILGNFETKSAVALYGAVFRLVLPVTLPLLVINAVIPPIISEMFSTGKIDRLEKTVRSGATIAAIPSFFLVVLYIFLGAPLLEFLLGSYYRTGYDILIILSLGQFLNLLTGSPSTILMMTGHQKFIIYLTLCIGTIIVGGSIWAVQQFGLIGLAWATSLGYIFHGLTLMIFVKIKVNIWTFVTTSIRFNQKTSSRSHTTN